MAKLTSSQVAARLGVSPYTVKRWYAFWENLEQTDIKKLNELVKDGMPVLPKYEVAGSRGDRLWDEDNINDLIEFKQWIPHTKNGIFQKYKNEGEK